MKAHTKDILSLEDIERLHAKYAPSEAVRRTVFKHCQIVAEIAEQLIDTNKLVIDRDFVRAAALLHDIGYYPLVDAEGDFLPGAAQIQHAVAGEKILRSEGLSEAQCSCCLHHIGVGLSKEDVIRQALPIPPVDYMPMTDEERLVMYADKFHSKKKLRELAFNSFEFYETLLRERFGEESVERWHDLARTFGTPELTALAQKHHQYIR